MDIKLEINDLHFAYRDIKIIRGLNLLINKGEICGLIGPSGIGKSTLLRVIAGLQAPGQGTIKIDGEVVNSSDIFLPPEKRGVGLVFQDFGLFPHLTVEKNIAFGLHSCTKTERLNKTEKMLKLISMTGHRKNYPYQLSGGQQQRVALARSLAPEPQLLLLDEPFSNLDMDTRSRMRREIKEILDTTGTTCILSTHDKDDIEQICHRVVEMRG